MGEYESERYFSYEIGHRSRAGIAEDKPQVRCCFMIFNLHSTLDHSNFKSLKLCYFCFEGSSCRANLTIYRVAATRQEKVLGGDLEANRLHSSELLIWGRNPTPQFWMMVRNDMQFTGPDSATGGLFGREMQP